MCVQQGDRLCSEGVGEGPCELSICVSAEGASLESVGYEVFSDGIKELRKQCHYGR